MAILPLNYSHSFGGLQAKKSGFLIKRRNLDRFGATAGQSPCFRPFSPSLKGWPTFAQLCPKSFQTEGDRAYSCINIRPGFVNIYNNERKGAF